VGDVLRKPPVAEAGSIPLTVVAVRGRTTQGASGIGAREVIRAEISRARAVSRAVQEVLDSCIPDMGKNSLGRNQPQVVEFGEEQSAPGAFSC
jgi:hypothetical protein